MVCLFFGLPGAGKTTVLTSLALKYAKPNSKYKHVYHNVLSLNVPGATYIDNECIGKYDLSHSLLLIDEAQLFVDNRDYKSFSKELKDFFFLHRHLYVDCFLFSQQWDATDKKIKSITDRCYYIYKSRMTGMFISKYYRIPYGIIIPDPKKNQQSLGEIIQGYCKPNIFVRIFGTKRLFRPLYYKYFDSFEQPIKYPALPSKYQKTPYTERQKKQIKFRKKLKKLKNKIFQKLRSVVKKEDFIKDVKSPQAI